jgi:hypothetical protein
LAAERIKIDNAMLGRETAVMFHRTSAVETLLGRTSALQRIANDIRDDVTRNGETQPDTVLPGAPSRIDGRSRTL